MIYNYYVSGCVISKLKKRSLPAGVSKDLFFVLFFSAFSECIDAAKKGGSALSLLLSSVLFILLAGLSTAPRDLPSLYYCNLTNEANVSGCICRRRNLANSSRIS